MVGNRRFVVNVGPRLLSEAIQFCNTEGMALYKPSNEGIHKIIYEKVSIYGVTTFWTQAKHPNNNKGTDTNEMVWM